MRLERRFLTAADLLRFMRKQRPHPLVQILFGAMIGVQRHGDARIARGHFVCERGERERSDHAIVYALSREIGRSAHGHLDDAVGFRFGEALQRGIQRLCARHVDRRIGIPATARGIQHLGITFRCCDSHGSIMPLFRDATGGLAARCGLGFGRFRIRRSRCSSHSPRVRFCGIGRVECGSGPLCVRFCRIGRVECDFGCPRVRFWRIGRLWCDFWCLDVRFCRIGHVWCGASSMCGVTHTPTRAIEQSHRRHSAAAQ